jgi:Icc protein
MAATEPIRLLHLTDLHLRAAPDGEIYGVRTDDSFRATVQRALGDRAWRPAALLVTGDIAEDPAPQVYERFRSCVEPLGVPVLCLPGNHDDPAAMAATLNLGNTSVNASRTIGRWRIILLDSFLPGQPGGTLGSAELQRLAAELADARDEWVLVAVHHQPLPMGSAWLDALGLSNGPALLSLLAGHRNVRAVVWGHVHQASDRRLGHLRLLSTPSTCAQFTPDTERCLMDTRPPAFRRLELGPDGDIHTEVHWLEDWVVSRRPPDSRIGVSPGEHARDRRR